MNRAQRRAAERAGVPEAVVAYAEQYACPDCASETELVPVGSIGWLRVYHDETCPTLRRMVARRE